MSSEKHLSLNYSSLNISTLTIIKKWINNLKWWQILLFALLIFGSVPISYFAKDIRPTFAVVFIVVSAATSKLGQTRISGFARDNGFEYLGYQKGSDLVGGTIFDGVGHSRKSTDILKSASSKFGLPPFTAFTYRYSTGSGKNKNEYNVATIKLNILKKLPRFVLDDRDNGMVKTKLGFINFSTGINLSKLKPLSLEGHFDDFYHLYHQEHQKEQIDILSILTPDFMDWLIKLPSRYDLEFNDNYLYIFSKGQDLINSTAMADMLRVADQLQPRVEQAIKHYHPLN